MDACKQAALITLLANMIAEQASQEDLVQLASILTQLGTTLGFIAAQSALEAESKKTPAAGPGKKIQETEESVIPGFPEII